MHYPWLSKKCIETCQGFIKKLEHIFTKKESWKFDQALLTGVRTYEKCRDFGAVRRFEINNFCEKSLFFKKKKFFGLVFTASMLYPRNLWEII